MNIYVDIHAFKDGDGSQDRPYRSISDAAKVAKPGDTVLVAPGVYRECVEPVHSGKDGEPITYRSIEPLGAVITGSERIENWELYDGTVWRARVHNSLFGGFNPYTTFVYGDWYFAKADKHTGAVYLNGRALYEVSTLEECINASVYECSWVPEESRFKWYTEQDEERDETVIYANFLGADPNRETAEINVRRRCFFPENTGVNYITVQGFTITMAATNWAPPAAFQEGMIGPHWSKGWVIEDCDISNSKCAGISLGRYLDPDNNNYFTYKYVKSPTQMERDSVCRGQYHGWLKENIGSHIIRRNNIHHCEQGGIIGRMGGVFSVIEDNHIHHINNMMELGGAEIAGIKLHAAIDVIMRRNHIHHCTMGIWCDWEAQGTRITQNLLHDNQRPAFAKPLRGGMGSQDIFVEVSHGPTLIDNNVLLSEASMRFCTQGAALVHNLICGALTAVDGGTTWRYTPYHIPHRTEVMGFMTILHGDDRFYNNIFVQKHPVPETDDPHDNENHLAGTWTFDSFPTEAEWKAQFDFSKPADMGALEKVHFGHLPVWCEGNAYLSGAVACKNEVNGFTDSSKVTVELTERDGRPVLVTNVYELIDGFRDRTVNSDILGCAFEPEQRFENPDGTAITFDRDYFGDFRGADILPGPFAHSGTEFVL